MPETSSVTIHRARPVTAARTRTCPMPWSWSWGRSKQVGIHDPAVALASLRAHGGDPLAHFADGPADEDLVCRAEVRAPPDVRRRRAVAEGAVAVEHDDGRACQAVLAESAAGGDQHRFSNVVERDAVACGQRLDRGYPRDDVVVEVDLCGHDVEDAQRAVVQRRIAPRQEGADAIVGKFVEQRLSPPPRPRRVPLADALNIGPTVRGGLRSHGIGQLDEAVAGLVDEPLADLAAQRDQIVLGGALVHREEDRGVVEGRDGLRRHVVGIACPDAYDVDASRHVASMPSGAYRDVDRPDALPKVSGTAGID